MNSRNAGSTAVLVLGMHRSGTSLVAGVLQRLGVDLGENLLAPQPDNPTGFFEHQDIVQLHDELLSMLGSAWDDPSSLPNGWQHDPRVAPFRERLRMVVVRDFADSRLWGVKDPRLCRLLPLWLELLDELRIDAKAVLVVRAPSEVSASLHKRNGIGVDQSTLLWLSHVLRSEEYSRALSRVVVSYDDVLSNWELEVERMRDGLGIQLFVFSPDVTDSVSSFLNSDLHHHRDAVMPPSCSPQTVSADDVFQSMVAWRHDGVSPLRVCEQAASHVASVERAARPIVDYLRRSISDVRAQLEANAKLGQELETRLLAAAQDRAEAARQASESAAREALLRSDIQAAHLKTEADAARQAQLRAEMQLTLEARFDAELQASLRTQQRTEAEARFQAQLYKKTVAKLTAENLSYQTERTALRKNLSEMRNSKSWRLTWALRVAPIYFRNGLNRLKRQTGTSAAAPRRATD